MENNMENWRSPDLRWSLPCGTTLLRGLAALSSARLDVVIWH